MLTHTGCSETTVQDKINSRQLTSLNLLHTSKLRPAKKDALKHPIHTHKLNKKHLKVKWQDCPNESILALC